jgi:hypothetical protein
VRHVHDTIESVQHTVVVSGQEHRRSRGASLLKKEVENPLGGIRVKVSCGLVAKHKLRSERKSAAQGHPLSLALREFARLAMENAPDPGGIRQVIDPRLERSPVRAGPKPGGDRDVLASADVLDELELLKYQSDAIDPKCAPLALRQGRQIRSEHAHHAGAGGKNTRDQVQQRRLS